MLPEIPLGQNEECGVTRGRLSPYSTPYFVYTEYLGPKLQTPIISPGLPALSLWNTAQLDPHQQAEARGSRGSFLL